MKESVSKIRAEAGLGNRAAIERQLVTPESLFATTFQGENWAAEQRVCTYACSLACADRAKGGV